MKHLTKTVQRSEDCYIQFTDEEMEQLDIKINDKFSCKIEDDGSIILEKYVPIEINFDDWNKETLVFLIQESCDKHIPVDEVIEKHLTDLVALHKNSEE
jgi:hypothetical protein